MRVRILNHKRIQCGIISFGRHLPTEKLCQRLVFWKLEFLSITQNISWEYKKRKNHNYSANWTKLEWHFLNRSIQVHNLLIWFMFMIPFRSYWCTFRPNTSEILIRNVCRSFQSIHPFQFIEYQGVWFMLMQSFLWIP